MKVRTQRNFNTGTLKEIFGVSIKPEGARMYCKYPVGHQNYSTIAEAKEAKNKISESLDNGAHLDYGVNGTAGINKHEYVRIVNPK